MVNSFNPYSSISPLMEMRVANSLAGIIYLESFGT